VGTYILPEVMWHHGTGGAARVASGSGRLVDADSGLDLYDGQLQLGMRHGAGTGAVYARAADGSEAVEYVGTYTGDWAVGLRHGHGLLEEVRPRSVPTSLETEDYQQRSCACSTTAISTRASGRTTRSTARFARAPIPHLVL
jgi:hypothetical protein